MATTKTLLMKRLYRGPVLSNRLMRTGERNWLKLLTKPNQSVGFIKAVYHLSCHRLAVSQPITLKYICLGDLSASLKLCHNLRFPNRFFRHMPDTLFQGLVFQSFTPVSLSRNKGLGTGMVQICPLFVCLFRLPLVTVEQSKTTI